jgi:hypothetical protein
LKLPSVIKLNRRRRRSVPENRKRAFGRKPSP